MRPWSPRLLCPSTPHSPITLPDRCARIGRCARPGLPGRFDFLHIAVSYCRVFDHSQINKWLVAESHIGSPKSTSLIED